MSFNTEQLLKFKYFPVTKANNNSQNSQCSVTSNESESQFDAVSSTVSESDSKSNSSQVIGTPGTPSQGLSGSHSNTPQSTLVKAGKRAVRIIGSDSDDDTSGSPWLSKENAISAEKPSAKNFYSVEDSFAQREFVAKKRKLKTMFPTSTDEYIESVIENTSTLERAIDVLMGLETFDNAKPEKSTSVSRKRIRQLSSDSDGEEPLAKQLRDEQHSQRDLAQNLNFLLEAFPESQTKLSKEDLERCLAEVGYDLEQAISLINSKVGSEESTISNTSSFGSIKSVQIARSLASNKKSKHKSRTDDYDVEDDYDDYDEYDDEEGADDYEYEVMPQVETNQQLEILSLLNDSTESELQMIPECSKTKIQAILAIRPFSGWTDLSQKLLESAKLSTDLITSCRKLLTIRKQVETLMKSCRAISATLQPMVSALMADDDFNQFTADCVKEQPSSINPNLKLTKYQIVGLNWLILMYENNLNGILGDEMGLGKTIQTIAFLAYLKERGVCATNLIVAPSSTLDNWLRELKTWCPSLRVLLYYGKLEERAAIRQLTSSEELESYDVIITTYNMVGGNAHDRAFFRKLSFNYAVFDEGHMLKNMKSSRYNSMMSITAEYRLLLTGTPLQNNLVELLSLLAFVMPDIFSSKTEHLKKLFLSVSMNKSKTSSYENKAIESAKNILKPFLLRRIKKDVLSQLPQKTEFVETVDMCTNQQTLYDSLKSTFQAALGSPDKSGPPALPSGSGSGMMMALRKCANHRLLIRSSYNEEKLREMAGVLIHDEEFIKRRKFRQPTIDQIVYDLEEMSDFHLHQLCQNSKNKFLKKLQLEDDEIVDSGKFKYLDELLPDMKESGDRVLLFSQFTMMLDIIEPYMKVRGHKYLRLDGQTNVVERQGLIDQYNNDQSIFVFLLSTRAGGLGINLTAANTVIIHDIDYNPYNDKQAEDRCHRVGQKRRVTVYRIISRGSIEEGMLRLNRVKLNLEREVTATDKDNEDESTVVQLLHEALES